MYWHNSKSVWKPGDFPQGAFINYYGKYSEYLYYNKLWYDNTFYLMRNIRWKVIERWQNMCTCTLTVTACVGLRPGGAVTCWIIWSGSYACCRHNLHHFCFNLVNVYLSRQMKRSRKDRKQLLSFHSSPPCLLWTRLFAHWICDYCARGNIIHSFGEVGSIYWLN